MSKKLVYLMVFVTLLGVVGSVSADPNVVAQWEFNDGIGGTIAYDSTANDNDGTLYNMEATDWGAQDCPELGRMLALGGTDEYIRVPDDATMEFGAGPFTISFWINTSGGGGQIIQNGTSLNATTSGKRYKIYLSGGKIMFDIDDNVTKSIIQSGNASIIGEWHHIACRRIDSGGIDVQLDGVQVGANPNGSSTGNIDSPGEDLYIGRDPIDDGAGAFLTAGLSDIRLYNRALTMAEILALAKPEMPDAWCPTPVSDGISVGTDSDLSWRVPTDDNDLDTVDPNKLSWTYTVYLDTVNPPVVSPVSGIQGRVATGRATATNAAIGGPLTIGANYYWRVDAIEPGKTHTGDVWTFVAGAHLPTLVNPTNSYTPGVEINVPLSWISDSTVTITHNVVVRPVVSGLRFTIEDQTGPFNLYDYTEAHPELGLTMAWNTNYDWWIEEMVGTTLVATGPTWKLGIRALECGLAGDIDGSGDCIVDMKDFAKMASEWLNCNWDDGDKASPCPQP